LKWIVDISMGGKTYRTRVEAPNAETAKYEVLGKIKFTQCTPEEKDYDQFDYLMDIMNGKVT
jgi:hypothetical protein